MNIDLAAQIKSCLSIREVCERYGVHFDNRGRALCPFHRDHHPSASVNGGRFHCFVCDLHLDIFDFTERLFSIDFKQAVIRLNEDFGLGLTGQKPDRRAQEEWLRKKRAEGDVRAALEAEYMQNVELYRIAQKVVQDFTPRTWGDLKRLIAWKNKLEYLDYWFKDDDDRAIWNSWIKSHQGEVINCQTNCRNTHRKIS